ncbi:MAG: DUF87 domain-containing protein [Anaerolineaceae bacterium]|nr:DUF87 domain-containing protein [Anaerolineaceae bacterium]
MTEKFYLGKQYDLDGDRLLDEKLLYDPDDLTTHAIITGMTGSGKTGLGVGILEEAALNHLPALILDPKGDLGNLLLHFPDLTGEQLAPWVDPQTASRKGVSVEAFAAETAQFWSEGMAKWGIGPEQVQRLKDSVQFAVYTPGSSAGIPINILSSFEAPKGDWETNREIYRERIASTVTAILGLVGMHDIDPLRSREHILLSNLFEHAWQQGRSLEMIDLITQIQQPPFDRLGAFPLNTFFPADDRMELAFLLNNFLASPSFQSWIEGQRLDIDQLLFAPEGKPRHSIFYLSHLSADERMFFVTLFFATLESWMQSQRGTNHLQTLVYFDEIMGYVPPVSVPPSKPILLRMMKQARAYGVGLILATQNPADVDYKGLSNAGTWLIGRLQTERDIDRLVDGLRSASGNVETADLRRMLSGMPKRTFLIHNVHERGSQVFQTRWVMNYLAGPMTRNQIPDLNRLAGANGAAGKPETSASNSAAAEQVTQATTRPSLRAVSAAPAASAPAEQRPIIPSDLHEVFLPNELGPSDAVRQARLPNLPGSPEVVSMLYRPAFFMQFATRFSSRSFRIEQQSRLAYLLEEMPNGLPDWNRYRCQAYEPRELETTPLPNARFDPLPDRLLPDGTVTQAKNTMIDWIYRTVTLPVKSNPTLKYYAGPEVSDEEFLMECQKLAQEQMQVELDKLESKQQANLTRLRNRIQMQAREVDEQQQELDQRKMEELGAHGELLLSLFNKRRKTVSSSLTKRRLTSQAKFQLEQEELELKQMEQELEKINREYDLQVQEVKAKWFHIAEEKVMESVAPYKKDIYNEIFGVAWMPFYGVQTGERVEYVPAWQIEYEEE